jgi:hypothetical protein
MKMGEVAKLTPDQRKKWSLQGRLRGLRERAVAADQGSWGRTHSVIQSYHSGCGNKIIALAEGFERGSTLQKYVGFSVGDPTKEFANARHIVGASPKSIISLVDKIWEIFPELKEYD